MLPVRCAEGTRHKEDRDIKCPLTWGQRMLLREDSSAKVIVIILKQDGGNKGLKKKLLKFLKLTHQVAKAELELGSLNPNSMFLPLAKAA